MSEIPRYPIRKRTYCIWTAYATSPQNRISSPLASSSDRRFDPRLCQTFVTRDHRVKAGFSPRQHPPPKSQRRKSILFEQIPRYFYLFPLSSPQDQETTSYSRYNRQRYYNETRRRFTHTHKISPKREQDHFYTGVQDIDSKGKSLRSSPRLSFVDTLLPHLDILRTDLSDVLEVIIRSRREFFEPRIDLLSILLHVDYVLFDH